MKINNKAKYGLLSLALVLAIPANTLASEAGNTEERNITQPESRQSVETVNNNIDTNTQGNLVTAIENESLEENQPSSVEIPNDTEIKPIENTQTNPIVDNNLKINQNDDILKVIAHKPELTKTVDGATNTFTISYMLTITGDDLPKDYTISVFALKNSQVKSLSPSNYIPDKVVKSGEEIGNLAEQIESDDIIGFRIKSNITYNGSVKACVTFDENAPEGDYSLYYMVTRDGESKLGKMDVKIAKSSDYDFYLQRVAKQREYELLYEEKESPISKLPYSKFLLNDSNKNQKLQYYIDTDGLSNDKYQILATYINPNTNKADTEIVKDPTSYEIRDNSLVKLVVKSADDKEQLIKDSSIKAYELSKSTNKKTMGDFLAIPVDNSQAKEKPSDLAAKIEKEVKEQKQSLQSNGRSIVEKDQNNITQEQIDTLTAELEERNKQIQELIHQAILYYELDKIEEIEKIDQTKADDEYKKLAALVKEAEQTTKETNKKLIELDQVIITDNQVDPLIQSKKDQKAIFNIGKLTPITEIKDLTKNSPDKSERDFAKRLNEKIAHAEAKIQTVTIGKEEDQKANNQKQDKNKDGEEENKNTYPILVNFLKQRSRLLNPEKK